MKIIDNVTGQTSIVAQPITKSSGTLIFGTLSLLNDLDNETITVYIERVGAGGNVYLATDVKLRDLILLSQHAQNDVLLGDYAVLGYKTWAVIELGFEAGIKLKDGEKIHIRLDNCTAGRTYDLSITENRENTFSHIFLEKKSISADETEKTIDVSHATVGAFAFTANLREVGLTVGGVQTRFTPYELIALMRQDRAVINLGLSNGTGTLEENLLVLDLIGIDFITFYKNPVDAILLTTFQYKELSNVTASSSFASSAKKAIGFPSKQS